MYQFVLLARLVGACLLFLIATDVPTAAQDRNLAHCLSIADVNERVDCLESGGTVSNKEGNPPSVRPPKQTRIGPSFDCRAANSSIERAICTDPNLSEWDFRMGQQYQLALRARKDANSQSVIEGQRAWLLQRNSRCAAVADTAVWACLLDMTKQRIEYLTKLAETGAEPNQTTPFPSPVQVAPQNQAGSAVNASPTNSGTPPVPAPVIPKFTASPSAPSEQSSKNVPPTNNGTPSVPTPVIPKFTGSSGASTEDSSNPLLIGLFVIGAIIGAIVIIGSISRRERRRRLVANYGEEQADLIIARQIWQGMTEDQLIESLGAPASKDTEVRRTKTKETWKYGQTGKNRFNNRVFVENGIVTGWKN
jgi:uncharacterized protein YecT (DUF1311 family)